MVEKYNIRTDLALEEKERFESDQVEVQGVVLDTLIQTFGTRCLAWALRTTNDLPILVNQRNRYLRSPNINTNRDFHQNPSVHYDFAFIISLHRKSLPGFPYLVLYYNYFAVFHSV